MASHGGVSSFTPSAVGVSAGSSPGLIAAARRKKRRRLLSRMRQLVGRTNGRELSLQQLGVTSRVLPTR